MDVAKSHVHQRLEFLTHLRNVLENWQDICYWGLQQISDGLALIANLESLMVVALPAAYLTEHIHVWQEIHFNATLAFTLASLAASTAHIE